MADAAPRHGHIENSEDLRQVRRLRSRLVGLLLLLVLLVIYGVIGYVAEGFSVLDAIYMTSLVLSTVGLREVERLDVSGKVFTVTLIFFGVALVLVTLTLIAGWIADVDWRHLSRRRRMMRRIDALNGHAIVCAYGRVGRAAAAELDNEGMPYVVIDSDPRMEQRLVEDGVPHVIGDASSEPVLEEVGVTRARGMICAADSDATNVYITLTTRALNPGIWIVARASDPAATERLYRAGADRVMSPYVTSGRHMALSLARPEVVDFLEVSSRETRPFKLIELEVKEGAASRRTIADVAGERMVLALRRNDGEIVASPRSDLVVDRGDLLMLLEQRSPGRPSPK
jgi:voltage-gated potassium channel